jgi:hypothetical protein
MRKRKTKPVTPASSKARTDGRKRVGPARRRHLSKIAKLGGKARAKALSRRRRKAIAALGGTVSGKVRRAMGRERRKAA